MKKTLLVSLTPCYPLFSGGALAQYYFIDGLKEKVQFVYCTVVSNDSENRNLELLKQNQPTLKVYSLNTNKVSTRKSIIRRIKSFFYILKRRDKTNNRIITDDFNDSYFSHVDHSFKPEFIELINDVIKNENIEQVQFDFYDTIDLCWAIPNNVRKIFIHHEVRFKRLQLAYSQSSVNNRFKDALIKKTECFERSCLREMDAVVVFNEDDARILKPDCPNLTVSPFAIPDELIINRSISKLFSRFIFVGGESHTPNTLGLTWFLDNIYIKVFNEINMPLWIIGDWSNNIKAKYRNNSNVIFCGIVESIEPFYEGSILINPILSGAGLRTKVLQAFANKVPVCSTRFGAEGCFSETENTHLLLFDDENEFLQVIKTANYSFLANEGWRYYLKYFNKQVLLNKRLEVLNYYDI